MSLLIQKLQIFCNFFFINMKLVILRLFLLSAIIRVQCKRLNNEELIDLVLTLKDMVQNQQDVISDQGKTINELKVKYFLQNFSVFVIL